MSNPNSFDEVQDASANPDEKIEGTETKTIDYEVKFKESQKEALRLLEEKRKLEKMLEERNSQPPPLTNPTDDLFPGFDQLDPEAQQNLIAYTNVVTKRAQEQILKDPAISFAKKTFNERKWDEAFRSVAQKLPLAEHEADFKAQFFNPNNVPDNVEDVIADLAKIYLFDRAKDLGAEEERRRSERVELEDITGGEKTYTPHRSLEDWQRLSRENPTKFAQLSKEFNEDMQNGRI